MEQLPPLWVSGDCDCSDRIGVDSARPGTEGALEECLGFSFAQVSAQNRGANLGHQCKPNTGRECECRLHNLFGSDVARIGMHDSHSRIDERTFRQLERARF